MNILKLEFEINLLKKQLVEAEEELTASAELIINQKRFGARLYYPEGANSLHIKNQIHIERLCKELKYREALKNSWEKSL